MKPDNLHKKERLFNKAVKKAEEQEKKGFFEGAALTHLNAVKFLSEHKYPEQIAGCFNNAGIDYLSAKKYIEAENCLQRALIISTQNLGKEHPDVANTLDILGCVYNLTGESNKAITSLQDALFIRLNVLAQGHPDIVKSLNNIGSFYAKRGNIEQANKYYGLAKDSLDKYPLTINDCVAEVVTTNHHLLQQEIDRLKHEKLEAQAALYQSKKLEYLGQMATLMAHNINQPIAVLRMAASGALSDVKENLFNPETELKPLLEKLLAQTKRLSDMMGNFRHFARGDRTVLSAVNLNDAIEAIYQLLFVAQYQLDQIDLQKEFSVSPMAHANEWALQEMLISLLSNARAAVKDKAHKQVAIKTWQQDQQVGFCIEDSGDGIAAENLPKLFTPFLSSKEEGMGLGLYFCRQISHDLGGSIEYYPSLLGGAGFKITLPAQQK